MRLVTSVLAEKWDLPVFAEPRRFYDFDAPEGDPPLDTPPTWATVPGLRLRIDFDGITWSNVYRVSADAEYEASLHPSGIFVISCSMPSQSLNVRSTVPIEVLMHAHDNDQLDKLMKMVLMALHGHLVSTMLSA